MIFWTVVLIVLAGLVGVAVIGLLLELSLRLGKFCRCGHPTSTHRGDGTECYGTKDGGVNPLGIKRRTFCTCKSWRPTQRSYWTRVLHGTEEHGSA